MPEKNYLTRSEQNIWEYIKDKDIVDNELVNRIFPEISGQKRRKILHSLYKKGYLNRAIKDLYYNPANLNSFYKVALRIRGGYIGLISALRFYNLIEYEDFTIFVITRRFRKKIELAGTNYAIQYIPFDKYFTGFEKKGDIYISSIEKTLFDCLLKPNLVGLSNITKAFYDAKPDWNKLIYFFKQTENSSLCQRTGYLLEMMKKIIKIPSSVFEALLPKVRYPVKLLPIKGKSKFNKKWKVQDNAGEKAILSWWN